jgi:hypothetical protein
LCKGAVDKLCEYWIELTTVRKRHNCLAVAAYLSILKSLVFAGKGGFDRVWCGVNLTDSMGRTQRFARMLLAIKQNESGSEPHSF